MPNSEIFRRLARAMEFDERELFETDRAIIDHVLASSDANISFDDLKEIGTHHIYDTPRVQFADLNFFTPSGKIEIASADAESNGHWRAPRPAVDDESAGGKFRVLSPANYWTLNTSYGNDAKIRQRMGQQSVQIHPEDAARLDLSDDQLVRLSNETGTLHLPVKISEHTQPGVVVVLKGTWPMFDDRNTGNVNMLNPGERTDMGDSSCVHNIEIEIAAV